jgi:hypothetical protein
MIAVSSNTSDRRWVLISAAMLLYATSALAAHSAADPQEQARQFIVAKPRSESVVAANTILTPAGSAQGEVRIDPQEQARQFILAKPTFGSAVNSKTEGTPAGSAQDNGRVDPQEQARQFILAKPNLGSLADRLVAAASRKQVTLAVPAPGNRGGHTEPR